MRILILGGDGMLGHMLFTRLKTKYDVKATLRQDLKAYQNMGIFNTDNSYSGVDVRTNDRLIEVLAAYDPDAIVNAVGIVKQRPSAKESIPSIEINSLFPHRLALLCQVTGARLIHLSTDCVFSGRKGNYSEDDTPDPDDLYGKTKLLGELYENHCITLRTSMIGFELSRKNSLLEWFTSQKGPVKGYKKGVFSGFTTIELSRIIDDLIMKHPDSHGLYHVSSEPISKYDLLSLVKRYLDLNVPIEKDEIFSCDRSLDSSRFRREFNYQPPSWEEMVQELCRDIKSRKH
jgi:dTDP-4-dehydrorhamnose reductase